MNQQDYQHILKLLNVEDDLYLFGAWLVDGDFFAFIHNNQQQMEYEKNKLQSIKQLNANIIESKANDTMDEDTSSSSYMVQQEMI